nr:sugar ABC transporter substrate-binding protein [Clostridia bacterium]
MKKILALLLALAMVLPLTTAFAEKELITIDVYNDAANYHGLQTGWFGKIVEDRFNMKLNIIAPQVAGDAVYQTRSAEGNLGDIVILDKSRFQDCLAVNLIKDISDEIVKYDNLMQYKVQLDSLNQGLGFAEGVYYGIPSEMADTSPVTLTDVEIYSSPMLRWDQYSAVGRPEMKNLQDLLNTLKLIHDKFPTNPAGDPAYPLSLWPDWDGNDNMIGIANVVQLTTWYGEKIKGSAILKPDNTFSEIYNRENAYYKLTKFLYDANQMGLVDPASGEQDWNAVCAKMSNGQTQLMWYSWSKGFWNSQERLDNGTAFNFVPVKDQLYYNDADAFFGTTRVFAVGSKVEGEKYERIMQFLDWYASVEGMTFQHAGIEGLNYIVEDGKFVPYKDNALMDNLPVPEEFGGGGYQDGNNAINQWIGNALNTNPVTGEGYAMKHWSSYKAKNMTQMKKEWQETFNAEDDVDWMKKNGVLLASPNVSVALKTDTIDIGMIRVDVNKVLCEYTWKMIFAEDEETFEALWDQMVKKMDGFGYKELYAFDCENYQVEVDAKIAAAEAVK